MTVLLLLASFVLIIGGAILFTNAVEWAGRKLNLGEGPVGSLLAAVGTALPESLIPIVAVLAGAEGEEVAIGAIIGAPFMLGTVAMMLIAGAALFYSKSREQRAGHRRRQADGAPRPRLLPSLLRGRPSRWASSTPSRCTSSGRWRCWSPTAST